MKKYIFTIGEKVVIKKVITYAYGEKRNKYLDGVVTKIGRKYYYVTFYDKYYEEELKIDKNTHEVLSKNEYCTYTILSKKLCKTNKLYYINKVNFLQGRNGKKLNFNIQYKDSSSNSKFIKNDIKKALVAIKIKTGLDIKNIKFEYGLDFAGDSCCLGLYTLTGKGESYICYNSRIYTNDKVNPMSVIYHELGHYIHFVLLKKKVFNIPKDNKSKYACKDHCEDFAEAFADYMLDNKNTLARNKYMSNIVKAYL